jgi:hypothetical protein
MHDPGLGRPTPSQEVTSVPELGIPYMEFRFLLGFVFSFTQAVTAAEIAGDVTLECGWRLGAAIRQSRLGFLFTLCSICWLNFGSLHHSATFAIWFLADLPTCIRNLMQRPCSMLRHRILLIPPLRVKSRFIIVHCQYCCRILKRYIR